VHTVATDGEATVDALIDRASEIGLGELGFTEHVRSSSTYFAEFASQVRAARANAAVRVFVGIEAKANDQSGTLDAAPEVIADAELVLGSVHRFPMHGQLVAAHEMIYEAAADVEYALALGLVEHAPIDVLSHPGGMCLRAFGAFPEQYLRSLMEACITRNVAIEINSSYTHDMKAFTDLCRELNPVVSIGSDVHRLVDLGRARGLLWDLGIGCP
jgi:putative hydrolase